VRVVKQIWIVLVLLHFLPLVLPFSVAKATERVVNPGQSIQTAVNNASAGDTILVKPGNYDERVIVSKSNITLLAEGEVTMRGFNIQGSDYLTIKNFIITSLADDSSGIGIHIGRAGWCHIENNQFLYNTWGGLVANGDRSNPTITHDCTIKNNIFRRNGLFAAEIRGQNHLFEGNTITHGVQHHPCNRSSAGATWLDADAIRFHGGPHVFRQNIIKDMSYGAVGYNSSASCSVASLANLANDFVTDSHTDCFQTYDGEKIAGHDILFEGNTCILPSSTEWVDGMAAKAIQASGNSYNLTFINNLIIADFLSLFEEDGGKSPHDLKLYHNTFIGSNQTYAQGLRFIKCAGDNQVKNNIFYGQENGVTHLYASGSTINVSNNCVYRSGGLPKRPADPNDVWGKDPLFIDSAKQDYQLQDNSPCIDQGIDLGVTLDFDGTTRPQGDACDMGAYENVAGSSIAVPGDFNQDHLVDGLDYVIWLTHYGEVVMPHTSGDGNGDGKVDGVDYVTWLVNYNS